MKKRNDTRYVSLALVLVLVLLLFAGCVAGGNTRPTNEDGTTVLVETAELSEEIKLGFFDYVKLPFSYLLS